MTSIRGEPSEGRLDFHTHRYYGRKKTTEGDDLVPVDCLATLAMESCPETWAPEEGKVNRRRGQDQTFLNLNALMDSRTLRRGLGLCHRQNHKLGASRTFWAAEQGRKPPKRYLGSQPRRVPSFWFLSHMGLRRGHCRAGSQPRTAHYWFRKILIGPHQLLIQSYLLGISQSSGPFGTFNEPYPDRFQVTFSLLLSQLLDPLLGSLWAPWEVLT